ncbi:MAG: hypothetical protein ACRYFX_19770 [Janthinobacterium lividum]
MDDQLAPYAAVLTEQGFQIAEHPVGERQVLWAYWPTRTAPEYEALLLVSEQGRVRAFLRRLDAPAAFSRPYHLVQCFSWLLLDTADELAWLLARSQLWQQARASAPPNALAPAPRPASPGGLPDARPGSRP